MLKTLLILIALAIVAFLIFNAMTKQRYYYQNLLASGETTTATILSAGERIFDPKNQRKEFYVTYAYEVDGKRYEYEDRVEFPDFRESLAASQQPEVRYFPDKPHVAYLDLLLIARARGGSY